MTHPHAISGCGPGAPIPPGTPILRTEDEKEHDMRTRFWTALSVVLCIPDGDDEFTYRGAAYKLQAAADAAMRYAEMIGERP